MSAEPAKLCPCGARQGRFNRMAIPSMTPICDNHPNCKGPPDYDEDNRADLQRVRLDVGLTCEALAKRLGLSADFVENVEAGRSQLNIGGVRRRFNACDAPYGYGKCTCPFHKVHRIGVDGACPTHGVEAARRRAT